MTRNAKKKLILASASKRRSRILANLGVSFKIVIPKVKELNHINNPEKTVRKNALRKNKWCREQFPGCSILAADTIVEFKGRIINKPSSMEEAWEFLRMLSGKTHRVFTGVAFSRPGGRTESRVDISSVTFKRLTDAKIKEYLTKVKPMDRAGAYDIDESGDLLIASFKGSRTNIMGLSSETATELLKKDGFL